VSLEDYSGIWNLLKNTCLQLKDNKKYIKLLYMIAEKLISPFVLGTYF